MDDCNPVSTPLDLSQKLTADMCSQTYEAQKEMEKVPYMEAIGRLLFAAQNTRPDISFAVNLLSRFSKNHGKGHWLEVKRILRYLKGTLEMGIVYSKFSEDLTFDVWLRLYYARWSYILGHSSPTHSCLIFDRGGTDVYLFNCLYLIHCGASE